MQRSNFRPAVFAANQIDDDSPQIGAGIAVEAAPALVEADEGLLSKIGSGRGITCQVSLAVRKPAKRWRLTRSAVKYSWKSASRHRSFISSQLRPEAEKSCALPLRARSGAVDPEHGGAPLSGSHAHLLGSVPGPSLQELVDLKRRMGICDLDDSPSRGSCATGTTTTSSFHSMVHCPFLHLEWSVQTEHRSQRG